MMLFSNKFKQQEINSSLSENLLRITNVHILEANMIVVDIKTKLSETMPVTGTKLKDLGPLCGVKLTLWARPSPYLK